MKHIAILVETSLASGREILTGISRYVDRHPDWFVFQHVGPLGAMAPEALRAWQGDGIIARIANQELLELIRGKGVPVIDVLGNMTPLEFPLVKCDDKAIGGAVARHFLENGLRNFAFIGLSKERWSTEREEGFTNEVAARQAQTQILHIEQRPSDYVVTGSEFDSIKSWLTALTLPVGLMVASDQFAPLLFEACHQLGLGIPENVSMVGVDNDGPFCNLCRPRLSSVQPDHERIGYLAAKSLSQLMNGIPLKEQVVEIATHTLHRRHSSDFIALDDPALVTALKYIREHAAESPGLDTVARISGLSRSALQRRTRTHLNRSVGDLILTEKLRLACEMLVNTTLPIVEVAERSGFCSQEYLNRIFKRHLKTTPKKYRSP
jgi:LacI family transcriptional regulator